MHQNAALCGNGLNGINGPKTNPGTSPHLTNKVHHKGTNE